MSDEAKPRGRKPASEKVEPNEVKESKPSTHLVKMYRGEQTADVHPDMVADYATGGWVKK